jgi:lysyl-tRNA synthetase class 2
VSVVHDARTEDAASVTDERAVPRPVPSRALDDRWPDRFAAVMYLFAVFTVVVSSMPDWRAYFTRPEDVVSALTIPVYPSLAYAALLAVMGAALRRRISAAWWLTFVWWLLLPEIARALFLAEDWDWPSAVGLVLVGAAIVLAWRVRYQFVVHRVAGSLRQATTMFVLGGAGVLAVGALLVGRFGHTGSATQAERFVLTQMMSQVGRHLDNAATVGAPFWVHGVIGFLGAVVVVLSALMLFRPPADTRTLSVDDEARVRTLLRDYGDQDSLGYFATRRDKAVVWDHDDPAQARAGVSFRAFGSISLASGNPVGDPEAWDAAIARWRGHARASGLSMAVMGAGESGAAAYARAGLNAFEIGDEAILDLRTFSLNGPGLKPVRAAVARLQRRGYSTCVQRHQALDAAGFAELADAAAQWRGDGGDERGFSMALGRVEDPLDGDSVLVTARDAGGALRGFLSFVPWGRNGLSLDLMRRDPTADNGIIELMVSALAERSAVVGVGPVSLNFAMFREAFERGAELGAGPVARLWRQALLLASRNWQLESLYRSNAKYQPGWQPRFLCFEYASDLPRVGAAAGNAEGFLSRPSLARLLRRSGADEGGTLGSATLEYAESVRALIPPPRDPMAATLAARVPEQVRVRRAKIERLRARGVDPYPVNYPRTHLLAEVRASAGALPPDAWTGSRVSVAGRVLLKRDHGGLGFATLRDGSGDLQVMVSAETVGDEAHALWTRDVDLGDHVGITGEVMTTRHGELTVHAESLALTSKAVRPLPDKHKGLTDPEARVRERYVDLIVRPEAREVARIRSTVVRSLRDSLHARGFMEVETPVLQGVHGGANARPFETHSNAYDLDMCLRIATELHLKRLVVGGLEQVFEIGQQFRNEGADSTHNPEFTSLEVYQTYADYQSMRVLTQEIVQEAATAVYGAPVARRPDADGRIVELDLSGDWPVTTVCAAVSAALGEEITPDTPAVDLQRHAARIGLDLDPRAVWGIVLEAIYGRLCEATTTTPVFYLDFPKDTAPLTRRHRVEPRLAEKWDLVMFGSEQGTAYSELIDPLDQRERLVAQSLLAAAGDPEAMQVDEDFLRALEYGMPPSGGMGLGIDRLVMSLTGLSIRDTILFPVVKPERGRSIPARRDGAPQ